MEEDIDLLEEFKEKGYTLLYLKYGDRNRTNLRIERAIENLVTRYKQLEEENKELREEECCMTTCLRKDKEKVFLENKIKEKIEELRAIMLDTQTKYKGTYALLDEWRNAKAQENILIELLEEGRGE